MTDTQPTALEQAAAAAAAAQEQGTTATPDGAPLQAQPPGVITDDWGLDGDMSSTIAAALERRWAARGSLTPDPDNPDDTLNANQSGQPDETNQGQADAAVQPTPETSATQAPGQDADAGAGAGAPEGAAPDDGTPPAPAPPPSGQAPGTPAADAFDLNGYARDYFGTDLSRQDAEALFSTLHALQSLPSERRAALDQILSGAGLPPATPQVAQTPAPTAPGPMEVTHPGIPQASPGQPPLPPRPGDDDPQGQAYYDQYLAPLVVGQQQLQQRLDMDAQQRQLQAQQQMSQQIDAASLSWRQEHADLSDAEFQRLTDDLVQSGIFNGLVARYGNVAEATAQGYEQMFWTNPHLRERALANASSGRNPTTGAVDPTSPVTQQVQMDAAERQARAGAVAGGGGAQVPRGEQPVSSNPQVAKDQMLAAIKAEWGNQPIAQSGYQPI